jgi:Domain of unknown function (DUF222)/HNH endonuclease
MAQTATPSASALGADGVAGLSNEELRSLLRSADLDDLFRIRNSVDGCIVQKLGEVGAQEIFRDDGATSLESWTAQRFGVSTPTARAYAHVGEKAWDLPYLVGSLCEGEISFDKVRALADVVTPGTERRLCAQAKECSVREVADIARSEAELARTSSPSRAGSAHDGRFLRFNDTYRTISAQLPPDSYARTKASLEARAKNVPTDGETPWDQRLCDGFLELMWSSVPGSGSRATTVSPYVVVAHVPLTALVEDAGETSGLAGELEHHGLIDGETVQRIACDATIAVAVDDDVGHTMYEGRARRFPSDAQRREVMRRDRHCRFPGCTNVTFTNVHHIVPWKPGGRTDLDNLALLCLFHHGMVHRKGWTMSGNANEELTFTSPPGRVMTSRPSPLWTRVAALAAGRPTPPKNKPSPKG